MGRYKIGHSYSSFTGGRQFGPWVKGDEVELDDVDAEWIERDSPGAMVRPRRSKPPAAPDAGGVSPVPEGTEKDVLAWIGEDAGRAQLALAAEQGKQSPRKGLVDKLTKLAGKSPEGGGLSEGGA